MWGHNPRILLLCALLFDLFGQLLILVFIAFSPVWTLFSLAGPPPFSGQGPWLFFVCFSTLCLVGCLVVIRFALASACFYCSYPALTYYFYCHPFFCSSSSLDVKSRRRSMAGLSMASTALVVCSYFVVVDDTPRFTSRISLPRSPSFATAC